MHPILPAGPIPPPARKRRVLIVDDHDFFAACLRTLLDNESDLVVCDVIASSLELGARIARFHPDLLVIDLSLGAENGLDLGRRLRGMQVRTPILFVSTLGKPARGRVESIPNAAFIAKSRRPAEFLAALRAILGPHEATDETESLGFAVGHAMAKL